MTTSHPDGHHIVIHTSDEQGLHIVRGIDIDGAPMAASNVRVMCGVDGVMNVTVTLLAASVVFSPEPNEESSTPPDPRSHAEIEHEENLIRAVTAGVDEIRALSQLRKRTAS